MIKPVTGKMLHWMKMCLFRSFKHESIYTIKISMPNNVAKLTSSLHSADGKLTVFKLNLVLAKLTILLS